MVLVRLSGISKMINVGVCLVCVGGSVLSYHKFYCFRLTKKNTNELSEFADTRLGEMQGRELPRVVIKQ